MAIVVLCTALTGCSFGGKNKNNNSNSSTSTSSNSSTSTSSDKNTDGTSTGGESAGTQSNSESTSANQDDNKPSDGTYTTEPIGLTVYNIVSENGDRFFNQEIELGNAFRMIVRVYESRISAGTGDVVIIPGKVTDWNTIKRLATDGDMISGLDVDKFEPVEGGWLCDTHPLDFAYLTFEDAWWMSLASVHAQNEGVSMEEAFDYAENHFFETLGHHSSMYSGGDDDTGNGDGRPSGGGSSGTNPNVSSFSGDFSGGYTIDTDYSYILPITRHFSVNDIKMDLYEKFEFDAAGSVENIECTLNIYGGDFDIDDLEFILSMASKYDRDTFTLTGTATRGSYKIWADSSTQSIFFGDITNISRDELKAMAKRLA